MHRDIPQHKTGPGFILEEILIGAGALMTIFGTLGAAPVCAMEATSVVTSLNITPLDPPETLFLYAGLFLIVAGALISGAGFVMTYLPTALGPRLIRELD
ncbi:hypothetical protein AA14337_3106 [Acetobacter malorum DSM 14337]|uniref:Uncharacterized protein n=1 Tax=Acetobacter malorum DSM 14337 TaxID=1307910 RepID=A0ABQ0PZP5_9PROT|nr:hypothetical protein [Acetobacter malorum]KXV05688.1 hypothetical protein AD930_11180 [Acetobacter malorum]GBQ85572.1 hypothetical protein AA14337_3106 [Acetobacter malorum DSM 14337]